MKVTNFNASRFLGKVQSTTKIAESSTPQLIVNSTRDKFTLNSAAMQLLGVRAGGDNASRILFIDLNIPPAGEPMDIENLVTEFNERFFIAVNNDVPLKKGKVSEKGDFSYTAVWGAMHINEPSVLMVKHEELVARGLAVSTNNSVIATQKIICDLARYIVTDDEGNVIDTFQLSEDSEPQPLYYFENYRFVAHTPNPAIDEDDDLVE